MLKGFLAVVVLLGVLMIGLRLGQVSSTRSSEEESVSGSASDSELSSVATPKHNPAPPPIRVSALKLFMDYQANEVAADNEFRGKQLEIQDVVSQIRKDFTDQIVLELATPNEFERISARLASGQSDRASTLQIGSVVTVHCEGAGLILGSPVLQDCHIVVDPPRPAPAQPAAEAPIGSVPDATPDENGIYSIANGVTPPQVLFDPEPQYSDEARSQKIGGTVTVHVVVDSTGSPQNPQVVTALGAGLDEKAIDAVERYRFKPAMYKGQPVPVALNINVKFQIF